MEAISPPEALRVDVATLRRRGVDRHAVACDLPVAWLAAVLSATDAEVDRAARIALEVLVQPRGVVYVQGRLDVAFAVPCGRCLAAAAVTEEGRVGATFVVGRLGAAPPPLSPGDEDEDIGLSADDLDAWTYDGAVLDLDALVAEHVRLAYPMRALCERGDACRGLCSGCGADLNAQAADGRTCEGCGRAVPATPDADPPGASDAEAAGPDGSDAHAEPSGPLADALRKLIS